MPEASANINGESVTISKSDVEEAFERTKETIEDFEHRYSPWHFIEINDERKPVKHVFMNIDPVSEVADSRNDFGTLTVEDVYDQLGFDSYNRKEHAGEILRDTFEEILKKYPERQGRATKDKRLYQLLVNKAPNFVKHISNKHFDEGEFIFRGTAGQGNWPNIPWVAVLHPEETDTTQQGVYIVYLFDPENQAVYATLNQGVTELEDKHGKRDAREILKNRAENIREKINLEGFSTKEPEFSDKNNLYGPSTIYQKKYTLGNLPDSDTIEEDLENLIRGYQSYMKRRAELQGGIGKDISLLAKHHGSEYDYDRSEIREKMEEFREKFPEEDIKDINLDEWAPKSGNPNKENTLYYWLEHETSDTLGGFFLGAGGAKNYIVRYDDGELVDHYDDNPKATFRQIKDNVVKALDLLDQGKYSEIEDLEPLPRGSILLRWFVFYRPEKIIPIYSKRGMKDVLDALDLEKPTKYFELNKKLLDYKNSYEVFSDWSNHKFMRFVWDYNEGNIGSIDSESAELNDREPELSKVDIKASLDADLNEKEILEGLYFPKGVDNDIVERVEAALNSGKHIIFTGPPGTGKTEIAERTAKYISGGGGDSNVTGYQLTTATSDWSTFDTVGGYMPDKQSQLDFKPGHILRRFKQDGEQKNELLVIDEINRSDIDKAFGQLFTVLSGQKVQLPFKDGEDESSEKEVDLIPAKELEENRRPEANEYLIPNSWRIMATMNTYDKTSLYEMSYAFMRRFSFVHIGAPEIPEDEEDALEMIDSYIDVWEESGEEFDLEEEDKKAVIDIWRVTNNNRDEDEFEARKIGPALVHDMLSYLTHRSGERKRKVTEAVISYIIPQLEGIPKRDELVEALKDTGHVDSDMLANSADDILR